MEGYNGRLDAIQCAMLQVKLRHLEDWNAGRRQAAARYRELLAGIDGVIIPYEPEISKAVYHLYVIRVADRDDMQKRLAAEKIGTALHYPVPLHLQNAYASLNFDEGDFPITEMVTAQILSLPMFPQLTSNQQSRVADSVRQLSLPAIPLL
jgi:dTDP-4-amino-4,6-dideoxygalactose transaminase